MEFFSTLMFFLVGIIVGVAVMVLKNRFAPNNNEVKQQLISLQQEQAQLKHEWEEQIVAYKGLAKNLDQISAQINQHIDDAESLIAKKDDAPAFPFFSNEATEILKKAQRDKREKVTSSDQPLDYSNAGSGVFKGITPKAPIEKSEA